MLKIQASSSTHPTHDHLALCVQEEALAMLHGDDLSVGLSVKALREANGPAHL